MSEDEQRKVAFDLAVEQVTTLKQVDFDSFHFYTLNQSSLMEDLWPLSNEITKTLPSLKKKTQTNDLNYSGPWKVIGAGVLRSLQNC